MRMTRMRVKRMTRTRKKKKRMKIMQGGIVALLMLCRLVLPAGRGKQPSTDGP